MDNSLSRRKFLKRSAVGLGAVAISNLSGIIEVGDETAFEASASEGLKGDNMTHVSIKLWPGRSEQNKQKLANAIVEDVVSIIGCDEKSISISVEDVSSGDWKKQVYDPEIQENRNNLYKKPGYTM